MITFSSWHMSPQGLRSIGPFVAERFIEIVKARNQLARLLGYEDFYGRYHQGCSTYRVGPHSTRRPAVLSHVSTAACLQKRSVILSNHPVWAALLKRFASTVPGGKHVTNLSLQFAGCIPFSVSPVASHAADLPCCAASPRVTARQYVLQQSCGTAVWYLSCH
jgi:hypothetical protein